MRVLLKHHSLPATEARFWFERNGRTITAHCGTPNGESIISASATANPCDVFEKAVGRRKALERLMEENRFPRTERKKVWDEYHRLHADFKNSKPFAEKKRKTVDEAIDELVGVDNFPTSAFKTKEVFDLRLQVLKSKRVKEVVNHLLDIQYGGEQTMENVMTYAFGQGLITGARL